MSQKFADEEVEVEYCRRMLKSFEDRNNMEEIVKADRKEKEKRRLAEEEAERRERELEKDCEESELYNFDDEEGPTLFDGEEFSM